MESSLVYVTIGIVLYEIHELRCIWLTQCFKFELIVNVKKNQMMSHKNQFMVSLENIEYLAYGACIPTWCQSAGIDLTLHRASVL